MRFFTLDLIDHPDPEIGIFLPGGHAIVLKYVCNRWIGLLRFFHDQTPFRRLVHDMQGMLHLSCCLADLIDADGTFHVRKSRFVENNGCEPGGFPADREDIPTSDDIWCVAYKMRAAERPPSKGLWGINQPGPDTGR